MSSEELIAGFKNALDRGQSIEDAKRSFTNAGYAEKEILEASQQINQGISSFVQQSSDQPSPQNTTPEIVPADQLQTSQKNPQKKSVSKKKVIILSIGLVVVLLGLGASVYFLI